jgi:gamma-glutamylcyclotransferase (GGCT)/AIG2-like uncharacterized protein YtfP
MPFVKFSRPAIRLLPQGGSRFIIRTEGKTRSSRRWAVLYFAYASNMNFIQMKRWCPGSRFLKTACLERQRFVYDGYSETWDGAVGNLVGADRERVWGALYEITEKDRRSLDAFEGYPRTYDRKEVDVKDAEGNIYQAMTYARAGRAAGKPHPDYEKVVLDGAKDSCLPEEYVDRYLRVTRI